MVGRWCNQGCGAATGDRGECEHWSPPRLPTEEEIKAHERKVRAEEDALIRQLAHSIRADSSMPTDRLQRLLREFLDMARRR